MSEYTMGLSWITALLNLILPRHRRAARAVALRDEEVASLVHPIHLPKEPWIHALLPYRDERVRSLMQAVKYYGERSVTEKVAPYAADYVLELILEKERLAGWSRVVIVPIPSSPKRYRERGYNQAALFARSIAAHVPDATYDESLLSRSEQTSQVHVPRSKRKQNMIGVFQSTPRAQGRYILLIDDVVESGATLLDARRALLDEGARGVIALAISH